jgi:hypothetical protein
MSDVTEMIRLSKQSQEQAKRLRQLQPFIQKSAHVSKIDRTFLNCLRASLSKSFEFCLEAYTDRTNNIAFFLVPSLRSICEDLIVLSYLAKMSSRDRNELVGLLIQHEIAAQVAAQSKFFNLTRPEQPIPVFRPGSVDQIKIQDSVRQLWKRNGWPGLTKSWKPDTRQIAQKNHVQVLTTLYDYIYRLTSGAVHFNPQALYRMGWGMRFSSSNFKRYYTAYARTYGLLLFCCYFELFGRFLRPNSEVSALIAELRFYLVSEFRWPEMITFEELGLEAPPGNQDRYLYRYVDAHQRKRRMLKSPAKTTTLRHVQGLLDNLSRDPECALISVLPKPWRSLRRCPASADG